MPKFTPTPLASLANQASAVATINSNLEDISTAIENTLSRDGSSPNAMDDDLDMNNNRVYNLPVPVSDAEPIRKAEFDELRADLGITSAEEAAASASAAAASALASGLSETNAAASAIASAASAAAAAATATTITPTGTGRLTLSSGVPVPETDLSAQTTLYFTPMTHGSFYVYDGTSMVARAFSELNRLLTTAYHMNNSIYDVFVFWNGSSLVLGTGAAWTNATTRALALEVFNGVWVNATGQNIRWGTSAGDFTTISARFARYVGSIRMTADGQVTDSAAKRLVFNAYNQVPRPLNVTDTTASWGWSTASYQQANGAAANRVEVLNGLSGSRTRVRALGHAKTSGATARTVTSGIGIDSTSTNSAQSYAPGYCTSTIFTSAHAEYVGYVGLGYHAINWLERGDGTDTQTWYGTNSGSANIRPGLIGEFIA